MKTETHTTLVSWAAMKDCMAYHADDVYDFYTMKAEALKARAQAEQRELFEGAPRITRNRQWDLAGIGINGHDEFWEA